MSHKYPEQRAMEFLTAHIDEHGYPPTMRQLASACGLSSSASGMRIVDRLQAQGLIERVPNQPRTIRIVRGKGATEQL